MKDLFSSQSSNYARYRPAYPSALFEFIYSTVSCFDLAWDGGTGNGQSASVLANRFTKVFATDMSEQQLMNAPPTNNIAYAQEPSEHTSLADNSVDLITVAQALHWFDLPAFYNEVRRVAKREAMLAAWTYNLLSVDDHADRYIHDLYFQTLQGYWDAERHYVDTGYANLPFPFYEIESPPFYIEAEWTLENLIGYLNTWSGLRKFVSVNKINPTEQLRKDLRANWQAEEVKIIKFPLYLKLAKVSSFKDD